MPNMYIVGIATTLGGILLSWILNIYFRNQGLKQIKQQGQDIIDEAQDFANELLENSKRELDDFKEQKHTELETFKAEPLLRIEDLQYQLESKNAETEAHIKNKTRVIESKELNLKKFEDRVNSKNTHYLNLKTQVRSSIVQLQNKLCEMHNLSKDEMLEDQKSYLKNQFENETARYHQTLEEDLFQESEKRAKQILSKVINRFERPYCPERGISNINFPDLKCMKKVLGADYKNTALLEKLIGVDLTAIEEKLFLNVSGFDPVRRELTRMVCERLIKDRQVDEKRIELVVQKTKKDLFKKIRLDGNRIAKELGLKNLHPEIRNMMGSLRYRYSFSQNQHFHCAEVGWLCGLMSAELQLPILMGRRCGMLHDIGKAMDHSIDGGHAVIGADFISRHEEKEDVVHAVRAHHFDVQPDSDVAYLVIAADAISGARPGARRSTTESYTQKMEDLIRIGNSYKEVESTYIVSAGREVRLVVDSRRVDDHQALNLSKVVAERIEEECVYPGTIRVTVIRQTHAIEYAK